MHARLRAIGPSKSTPAHLTSRSHDLTSLVIAYTRTSRVRGECLE